MKTIAVIKSKGGSGATTLTACMLIEAQRRGLRAAFFDRDPQFSLTAWFDERQDKSSITKLLTMPKPEAAFDVVLIDHGPADLDVLRQSAEAADLCAVPYSPSPLDLGANEAALEIAANSGTPYAAVVTRVKPRAKTTEKVRTALAADTRVCPATLGDRTHFADAMADGLTGPETAPAASPSAAEVAAIFDYMMKA